MLSNPVKQATVVVGSATIVLLIIAAFANSARAEYVKRPVTGIQRIEAKCNMAALNSMNGFSLMGDYMVATTVKQNCMAAEGYVWKKPPRSAKAKKPAGTGRNKE